MTRPALPKPFEPETIGPITTALDNLFDVGIAILLGLLGFSFVALIVAMFVAMFTSPTIPDCSHSCPQGTFVSKCSVDKFECAPMPATSIVLPETRIEVR